MGSQKIGQGQLLETASKVYAPAPPNGNRNFRCRKQAYRTNTPTRLFLQIQRELNMRHANPDK